MIRIAQIDIWGDSILKGVVLDEAVGRYRLLRENAVSAFSQLFHIDVRNHSHFGCTAPKALASIDKTLASGLATDLVLLEFGGNDCDFNWKAVSDAPGDVHQPNTEYNEFIRTMRDMCRSLKEKGIRPVLMSLPPIDSERYFNWITRPEGISAANILRFLGEKQYIYRHQELYSLAITRIAYEEGVAFVDVREAFLRERRFTNLLCADGIHPNEKGQKVIRDAFSTSYSLHKAESSLA
jgi:lysophospholipase L1-like esterase